MALLGGFVIACAVGAFAGFVLFVVMVTFGIAEVPNWIAGVWFLFGCAVWAVAYAKLRRT